MLRRFHLDQGAEFTQKRRRRRVVAALENRIGEFHQGMKGGGGVEVVVERSSDAIGVSVGIVAEAWVKRCSRSSIADAVSMSLSNHSQSLR